MKPSLAVLGAGPIGLEAALAAQARGYDVQVWEQGEVADSAKQWGHVQMFSPFHMNASVLGRRKLAAGGWALPEADALLTGREFRTRYLCGLGTLLGERLHCHAQVVSVSRAGALKTEHIGEPSRGGAPFRLHVREGDREHYVMAEVVLDCTGTYRNPNPLGEGGQQALGEAAAAANILYGLKLPAGEEAGHYLVVGGGHSAATAVRELAARCGTKVTWVQRTRRPEPLPRLEGDPLPARDGLAREVNGCVRTGRVAWEPGAIVEAVERVSGGVRVSLRKETEVWEVRVRGVICATGFRPDPALARELQVQTCWATEGTYPLAASLLGESGGDCLAVPAQGAETLRHPEPGYFALGMKSYGRTSAFLLQTGLAQIEALLAKWDDNIPC